MFTAFFSDNFWPEIFLTIVYDRLLDARLKKLIDAFIKVENILGENEFKLRI